MLKNSKSFIDDKHCPLNELVAFLQVFSTFNYDSVVVSMYSYQASRLKEGLENKVRAKISGRFLKNLNQMIDSNSKLLSFINDPEQGQFSKNENLSSKFQHLKNIHKDARNVANVSEAKCFYQSVT